MILPFISLCLYLTTANSVYSNSCDLEAPVTTSDTLPYQKTVNKIERERMHLNALYNQRSCTLDSAGMIFTRRLVNGILPYWYGTDWDFNGYTDKPRLGQIACGYLVSTILKHAGIRVNRYKMAQKSAMDGALMLEARSQLDIEYTNRDSFIAKFLMTKKDGLYMIGLSNHVGYLYKVGHEAYFIHSSYLSPGKVTCEKALASDALSYTSVFVVADITYNHLLISKWLKGEVLPH